MKRKVFSWLLTLSIIIGVTPIIPAHAQNNTNIYLAYSKILDLYVEDYNGGESEGVFYTVFDVDNNNTKELIVGFGGSTGYELYSFDNNSIIECGTFINNDIGFYEQNGCLYVISSNMTGIPYEFEVCINQIDLYNNKPNINVTFQTIYTMNHDYYSTQWINEIPQAFQLIQNSNAITFLEASDRSALETLNEIKVVLNGEEIEFDQPPIMEADRILVPIRKIAEAMGDTVLWNDEYQTAFIKHGNRGLIIKLLDDHIKIVENEYWTQWEEKELDVMAVSLNGRTLVPVRAFCESLGADVTWVEEENAAYLTYDFKNKTEEMDVETFKNINTVYYALNNDDTPFDVYSEAFEYFYNNRDRNRDAIKMGISDIWAGVNDLLSGLSNAENIMKDSLEQMLSAIPDNDIVTIDIELFNDIKGYETNGKYIFDEVHGIDEQFLKQHPDLKALDTSIKAVGTAYDILSFSTEQLTVFLSNYEMNIQYLRSLKSILENNGLMNDELNTSISVLEQEYADKFFNIMLNARDELEKFTITESANLATGGFFAVGLFGWEQLFKLSGITEDGHALKTFYGLFCINGALDEAYIITNNKIESGVYHSNDVAELKQLDDLQRALKIKTFESIKTISEDKDTHEICKTTIDDLSKSCLLWVAEQN